MTKTDTVVIDTNLFLDDATIIYKLSKEYDKILIPITVLKELDSHKFKPDTSFSARNAIKAILSFSEEFPNRITFTQDNEELSTNDLKIINSAENNNADIATKDISMSIVAKGMGINVKLYDVVMNNLFNPYIFINSKDLIAIQNKTQGDIFSYGQELCGILYERWIWNFAIQKNKDLEVVKNSWTFILIGDDDKLCVYANNPLTHKLIRIDNNPKYRKMEVEDNIIKSRDVYQTCAIFALMEAPHVLITGSWGTGKTLLATSYTLATSERKTFITRPPTGINTKYNLGFLPGPQPLSSKILTPTGWTTIGKIKKGDRVISQNGLPTIVEKVFDLGEQDVYEIETTNGGKTRASSDHLWVTKNYNELKHNKDFKLRTTFEIKSSLLNPNTGPKYNHSIPNNNIIIFDNSEELPIPAYTLGALLGDGSFSDSVSIINTDTEIINRVRNELLKYNLTLSNYGGIQYHIRGNYKNNKSAKKLKLTNINSSNETIYNTIGDALEKIDINRSTLNSRCVNENSIDGIKYEFIPNSNKYQNYIKESIYELGLENTKAHTKFIPDKYKYTSVENRIALLQGLMDTDGTIKESNGEQSFTTTSKLLCKDIIEICRSLGLNATYYTRNRIDGADRKIQGRKIKTKHISYEVSIPKTDNFDVFYISRKRDKIKKSKSNGKYNKIKNITFVGKEKVRCIKVADPSSLYITDDYIITHNTKEDKMIDWCAGFLSALYFLYHNTRNQKNKGAIYDYVKEDLFNNKFEIIPINMIQGMSLLNDDIMIVDEVQLLDINYMSMILSRPSETGKLILLGDLKQTYSVVKPSESGLLKLLRALPHPSLAYVELQTSYRSNLLEVAEMLQDKTLG